MEIYVSDDIYEYLTIGKRDIHSGVDDDLVVKSLEAHDKELLREFTDKLKDKIINENTNEQGNLDYNVDLTGLLDDINELLKERGIE